MLNQRISRRSALRCVPWMFPVLAWAQAGPNPLPSWNNGPAKAAIIAFVTKVTTPGGPDFIPQAERIATFDNDGTLWTEQPLYVEFVFALDRVKALAPQHPEWKTEQPFRAVLENDEKTLLAGGETGLMKIMAVTHSGMTSEEFQKTVTKWIATARHPRFKRLYTELVYQPMLELLAYLRASGFKTFIVSGGGVEFMRPWTERAYGIPPEQVVGSMGKLRYEMRNGTPVLLKEPAVDLVDDKAGKPVGIQEFIGRRPVFAAGNSDGDLEMLQWTTVGRRASLGILIHHTDTLREYAYDRNSKIGQLNIALDQAPQRGWVVVDMKNDWKVIFPFQK
jgi:phosphoglycolate phosphatase-like HAD superfamily hydrolase